jgi:hypothetical protein
VTWVELKPHRIGGSERLARHFQPPAGVLRLLAIGEDGATLQRELTEGGLPLSGSTICCTAPAKLLQRIAAAATTWPNRPRPRP